jgi:hypothetical protein
MSDIDRTLDLAKRGQFSRSELYWRMQALADQQREPGQSQAQAFAKFVQGAGRELMQIHCSLSAAGSGGVVGDYTAAPNSVPIAKSVVEDDWDRLIRVTKKAAGCSESEAIDAALSSEAGRYAFAKRKRSDQIATGQFTIADMRCLDGAAAEQDQYRELHKRDLKSDYEAKFDEAKQMYPHLSDSKVHDFVRARHPEAWEEHKKLNKLGGGQLPRSHVPQSGDEHPRAATSGRGEPSHAPQWHSDHSGSTPTTPARTPERLSDTPAIKILDDLARNSGLSRADIAKYLCTVPTGRQLVMMAAMERRRD